MRRRLGARKRREFWDYGELFSVTLLLVFWSVFYRAVFTFDVVTSVGEVGEGWLFGRGVPGLWATLFVVSAALALTGGCLLDERNRTGAGYGFAATNAAFAAFFGIALANHTAVAEAHAVARAEGRRTSWNLERDVRGRWEVVARDEPPGAPRFPADVIVVEGRHDVWLSRHVDPLLLESWWEVESAENVAVDLPAARWCWPCFAGETIAFGFLRTEPPALLLNVLSRNRSAVGDSTSHLRWVASVSRADPQELSLRSEVIRGREVMSTSTVKLARASKPTTGFDLGAELAHLRDEPLWW